MTPDSFSDGNLFFNKKDAVNHAIELVAQGADIIDVGGESTRSGAIDVSESEELERVLPVISAIRRKSGVAISIDTRKSSVAKKAIEAGARIINDVSGLAFDPNMAEVAAKERAFLIVMHMKFSPLTMQNSPRYHDVVKEVKSALNNSVRLAIKAGVSRDMIAIDPGIGFAKNLEHNLKLLNRLEEFRGIAKTICVGTSRKSFIGKLADIADPKDRMIGSIASSVIAISKGAGIIRVHDVKEAKEASIIADAILNMRR